VRPIDELGFGIVAYLDILWSFFTIFVAFSILLVPTFWAFNHGKAVDKVFKGYDETMVSNLGYSSTECEFMPISVGRVTMQCPFGTVGQVLDYGVNVPTIESPVDTCMNNDLIRECKPDYDAINKKMNAGKGSEFHTIDFNLDTLYWNKNAKPKRCNNNSNYFFVQYSCVQEESVLKDKYTHLVTAVSTGTLICLIFFNAMRYKNEQGKLQQVEWDVATITAGDYAVELPIPQELYYKWKL
jgi:hypothetical protein